MPQVFVLMVLLLYPGEHEIEAQKYEQQMPTLEACWDAAHAIVAADISRAEPMIGVGAGCTVIGKPTQANAPQ